MTGEISSLEHELGNDTVEGAVGISLPPKTKVSHHHHSERRREKIRSHFVPYTIHGNSWRFWESHHHTTYYNNVSKTSHQSIAPVNHDWIV